MLEDVITSKTRIKLLIRFFLNPESTSYLRELAGEFGKSTTGIREELQQMVQSKLLKAHKKGRNILYQANTGHPLFPELQSMVQKSLGMDRILESILSRLGDLEAAYLIDDYAEGRDTGVVDLLLIGSIDLYHLNDLSRKTERYIGRKIRSLVFTREELDRANHHLEQRPHLLLWKKASEYNGEALRQQECDGANR